MSDAAAGSQVSRPSSKTAGGGALRILHLYSGNLYGGIERLLGVLNRLQREYPMLSHQFALTERGQLWDELTRDGAVAYELGHVRARHPWTVISARRRLDRILSSERPDWVMCHTPWPHALLGATVRRAGVPLATFFHDKPSRTNRLDRHALRVGAQLYLANSRYTAEHVRHEFPKLECTVLHCPVEPHAGQPDLATREEQRKKLGVAPSDVVFLQASRFERWKGLHVFVEALVQLRSVPGWCAWLAGAPQKQGESEYLQELQARADTGGIGDRLRFLGWRADARDLMACADVVCQPNTGPEPFGLVFVEALSQGTPVIATRLGGATDIVTPECGILVPPADPSALAAAMLAMIESPSEREQMGRRAPARARQLVDPAIQLRRMKDLLLAAPLT